MFWESGEQSLGSELAAAPSVVHIWWWRPPERSDPQDLALLDTDELRRALCMLAERDAAAFARTHGGTRRVLGELLGVAPESIVIGRHTCGGCGDDSHGRPRLVEPPAQLSISLSRTEGHGLLVVSMDPSVGIDAEAIRPVREAALFDTVLTEHERAHLRALPPGADRDAAFHRIWTRKEAVVKAVGVGLIGTDLARLETRPELPGPVMVRNPDPERPSLWLVQDLDLAPDLAAAVARPAGPALPVELRVHVGG
ncbi:4'-phosphopantetheinyl transferase [Streptacidiphilus sp. MAP12-33]|uniref:4'-phosphopantetheinyl transferase family protein n=1 Tax=Streptacidiphilus sp. MAP12-33 TaxID=3156266 RepID=UPI003518766A